MARNIIAANDITASLHGRYRDDAARAVREFTGGRDNFPAVCPFNRADGWPFITVPSSSLPRLRTQSHSAHVYMRAHTDISSFMDASPRNPRWSTHRKSALEIRRACSILIVSDRIPGAFRIFRSHARAYCFAWSAFRWVCTPHTIYEHARWSIKGEGREAWRRLERLVEHSLMITLPWQIFPLVTIEKNIIERINLLVKILEFFKQKFRHFLDCDTFFDLVFVWFINTKIIIKHMYYYYYYYYCCYYYYYYYYYCYYYYYYYIIYKWYMSYFLINISSCTLALLHPQIMRINNETFVPAQWYIHKCDHFIVIKFHRARICVL